MIVDTQAPFVAITSTYIYLPKIYPIISFVVENLVDNYNPLYFPVTYRDETQYI